MSREESMALRKDSDSSQQLWNIIFGRQKGISVPQISEIKFSLGKTLWKCWQSITEPEGPTDPFFFLFFCGLRDETFLGWEDRKEDSGKYLEGSFLALTTLGEPKCALNPGGPSRSPLIEQNHSVLGWGKAGQPPKEKAQRCGDFSLFLLILNYPFLWGCMTPVSTPLRGCGKSRTCSRGFACMSRFSYFRKGRGRKKHNMKHTCLYNLVSL